MKQALLFTVAALALAQPQLAIRGSVTEGPAGPGIAGVEVKLKEFRVVDTFVTGVLYATAYTDAQGAFEFKPERLGDYFVEAAKPGYQALSGIAQPDTDAAETSVSLTEKQPEIKLALYLVQPGDIEGRIVDDDGLPLANQSLWIEPAGALGLRMQLQTDAEGSFRSRKLQPGSYVVGIGPQQGELPIPLAEFTDEDAAKIDRDIETSYWPGGAASREAALPITVAGGATANVGVIRPRSIDRYRVRLHIQGADCAQDLMLIVVPDLVSSVNDLILGQRQTMLPVPCKDELLAIGLAPGLFRFQLINRPTRAPGQPVRWAQAIVNVRPDADPVQFDLQPGADVPVRFFAFEGGLPDELPVMISLGSGTVQAINQRALVRNVMFPEPRVNVVTLGAYYVSSMRYGGQPVANNSTIKVTAGAELEVVLDDHGAKITGSVEGAPERTFVLLLRPDAKPLDVMTGVTGALATPDGRFTIPNLAPGDYRVVAVPAPPNRLAQDPAEFTRIFNAAQRVTLYRGDSRELNLRLIPYSR